MIIRKATESDIPAIVAIGERFTTYHPYNAEFDPQAAGTFVATLLRDGIVFVADEGGQVVGTLVGMLTPLWYAPATMLATEIGWWLDEDHRRGMNGLMLLRAFENWAKEQKANVIILSDLCIDGEYPAGRLIEARGYRVMERTHIKEVL